MRKESGSQFFQQVSRSPTLMAEFLHEDGWSKEFEFDIRAIGQCMQITGNVEAEIRQSQITRNEADLLLLSYPRFCLRVYLPRNGGFLNLRRVKAIRHALSLEKRGDLTDSVPTIADCLLRPNAQLQQQYQIVTCSLGEDYGEPELKDVVPFVKHLPVTGSVCGQACCWMVTSLLRDWSKSIVGLSEISFWARDTKDRSEVKMSGLDGTEVLHFLEEHAKLSAAKVYPPTTSDDQSIMAENLARLCRTYLKSGLPVLLPVNAREWKQRVTDEFLRELDTDFGLTLSGTTNHMVLLVGISNDDSKQEILVNDPTIGPFLQVDTMTASSCQDSLRPKQTEEQQCSRVIPVAHPSVACHPLRFSESKSVRCRIGIVDAMAYGRLPKGIRFCEDTTETLTLPSESTTVNHDVDEIDEIFDSIVDQKSGFREEAATIWGKSEFRLYDRLNNKKAELSSLGLPEGLTSTLQESSNRRFVWIQKLLLPAYCDKRKHGLTFWLWEASVAPPRHSKYQSHQDLIVNGEFRLAGSKPHELATFIEESLLAVWGESPIYEKGEFTSPRNGELLPPSVQRTKGGLSIRRTWQSLIRRLSRSFSRPWRPAISVLTSFAASKDGVRDYWPPSVNRAELYLMMQETAQEVSKSLSGVYKHSGMRIPSDRDCNAVSILASLAPVSFTNPESQIDTCKLGVETTAQIVLEGLPQDCQVTCLATYIPSVSAAPGTFAANMAIDALSASLLIAKELGRRGHPCRCVEIVAGSRLRNPQRIPDGAFTMEVMSDEESQQSLLINLCTALERFDERKSALGLTRGVDPSFCLELEPGPLFVLRDIARMNVLAESIDRLHRRYSRRIGFNYDIGHVRISRQMSQEAGPLLTKKARAKIGNAHISGVSPLGHLADLPLAEDMDQTLQQLLDDYLVDPGGNALLATSGSISLELEVTSKPGLVADSARTLQELVAGSGAV